MIDVNKLYDGILNKDRSALAQAITLIESSNEDHCELASQLLDKTLKVKVNSKRVGISGTPGVGKSTFIEAFGNLLLSKGHKVAVLAIDPTSYISGGSILGDKTRMSTLSFKDDAFIRPTPSSKYLGGVAKKTKETIHLCEVFGFDYIIVETVGVGQSEVAVSDITDHLMLLMQPASGDELQGIKRGILELADSIVVNKADGDLIHKAKITKAELDSSIHILRKESVPILLCSAINKTGIEEIYAQVQFFFENKSQLINKKRFLQDKKWVMDSFKIEILKSIDSNKEIINKIDEFISVNNLSLKKVILALKDILKK